MLSYTPPNIVLTPLGCASYDIPEWADALSVGCFNSHNASSPMYTDLSIDGPWDRPWFWLLCNEPFAFWQKYIGHSSFFPSPD